MREEVDEVSLGKNTENPATTWNFILNVTQSHWRDLSIGVMRPDFSPNMLNMEGEGVGGGGLKQGLYGARSDDVLDSGCMAKACVVVGWG